MDYKNIYELLLNRLKSVRNAESRIMLLESLFTALSIIIPSVIILILLEIVFEGDSVFRASLAALIIIAFILPSVLFLRKPIMRRLGIKHTPPLDNIALRVGNVFPEVKDKLCNSLQIISEIDKYNTSQELAVAALSGTYNEVKEKDFSKIIEKRNFKKSLLFFCTIAVISSISFVSFSNQMGAALYRIVNWEKSFLPPAPFSLDIEPKNKTLMRGADEIIKVTAIGKAPLEIKIHVKEFGQENFDEYNLKSDSANIFIYKMQSVKTSLIYYASAEWLSSEVKSQECTLKVIDKPFIRTFYGNLTFPSYTKLPSRKIDEQSAEISALRGSNANFELISNKKLKSAEIILLKNIQSLNDSTEKAKDSTIIKMRIEDKKAFGGFGISNSGQYYIKITDTEGNTNENPIKYNIYAINDDYPSISLLEPIGDAQVSEDARLRMYIAIADDYGFSSLKLHYKLIESKYTDPEQNFKSIEIPIISSETAAEVPYLWDLNKMGISPEDKYEYYLEVFDNDRVSGFKSSKTNVQTVRLPSLDEVIKQADQAQNKIEKDLEKIAKQSEEVKKEMEELNRDLLKDQNKSKEMNWEQRKKAEDLMKKKADLQNKLSDIQKNLEQVTENLKENNVLSPETIQKYMELQKLMQEVNSPELKKMQDKLKQAMDKLTPEQMQDALKNFKMDEEKFKQSIERTMKMLKRIQTEQKIDALMKKTDEMVNKLDDLSEKMDNTNPNSKEKKDELANNQEGLNKDFNDMKKDIEDLEKMLNEMGKDAPNDQMQDAKDQLNQQETSQEMSNSQKNMQSGDFNKAKQNQSKAKKNMKNFSQSLKKMKDEMKKNNNKEAIRKMQKAASDISQLSKNQEKIKNNTQGLDPNSMQYKDIAKDQADNMAAMNAVVSSLFELSQKSFAVTPQMAKDLGDAMNAMQQSIGQLTERQMNQAAKAQEGAMASMNKSISQMQQMIARMQKTGSCSNPGGEGDGDPQSSGANGMMQKLQELAAQQQAINQSMQGMENMGSMSPEQQAQAERLSKQQGNAKKTMEELAKEQKEFSGGKRKPLGNLDKIAQEMEEVLRDMKSGQVTPETRKKQERILSRLLDATKSMTERDFEKKREARSGEDVFRQSPKDIDMSTQEGKNRGLQEFLRSIQKGYTKDYELLIKQYFEGIQSGN